MKKWIKQFHTLQELDRKHSRYITRGYYGYICHGRGLDVRMYSCCNGTHIWDLFVLIYRHREVVYYITRTRTIWKSSLDTSERVLDRYLYQVASRSRVLVLEYSYTKGRVYLDEPYIYVMTLLQYIRTMCP